MNNLVTMELMNQNYKSKKYDNKGQFESNLGEVEKFLVDAFFSTERSNEEMDSFASKIYGNSRAFEEKSYQYISVDTVYPYFNQLQQNMTLENNQKTM